MVSTDIISQRKEELMSVQKYKKPNTGAYISNEIFRIECLLLDCKNLKAELNTILGWKRHLVYQGSC